MSEMGFKVEHGNVDIYRFYVKKYTFFTGAFNPAKTNSKLWKGRTQCINAAGS